MREVTATEVAEVLEEAADLYESGTYGWVQGMYSYYPPLGNPRRCMLGIIDAAAYKLQADRAPQMSFKARRVMNAEIGHIANWNDEPERTVDEVVEVLKGTAKDLRNSQ